MIYNTLHRDSHHADLHSEAQSMPNDPKHAGLVVRHKAREDGRARSVGGRPSQSYPTGASAAGNGVAVRGEIPDRSGVGLECEAVLRERRLRWGL